MLRRQPQHKKSWACVCVMCDVFWFAHISKKKDGGEGSKNSLNILLSFPSEVVYVSGEKGMNERRIEEEKQQGKDLAKR